MYYSLKTKNKSFINMWRYLQRHNIENNLFMLETKHKELVDFSIEKYYEYLNEPDRVNYERYKSLIIEEVKQNIWFYFRELAVVPDEDSFTGYKQFELTPENMLMIYLYDNNKSFINFKPENDACLQLLWNRHVSLINNDIVLVNNNDAITEISDNVRKCIANMEVQVPIGSNQVISDHTNRYITCGNESIFKKYYFKSMQHDLIKSIDNIYSTFAQGNPWVKNDKTIFILENDMTIITYSCIIKYFNNDNYKFYLNGIHNDSIDSILLKSFITGYYTQVNYNIYDIKKDNMENVYII